jgi:Zn-dependent metalloprotease
MGKDPQPAHMDHYLKTTRDKGGVHLNSGIPNRAFALFATAVGGFAWDKAAQVWFAARAEAGNNPSFGSFAFHTVNACSSLGFSSETDKLVAAWQAVGVTPDEHAVDDLTPAPVVPPSHADGSAADDEDDGHSH